MNYYDHIESYLEGRLSEDMKHQMEREISGNNALAEAVENYPLAKEISRSIIEDETRQILDAIPNDYYAEQKSKFDWSPWIIAAMFIGAMLVSYYQWQRHDRESKIYASAIEQYTPIKYAGLKGDSTKQTGYEAAIDHYELGEYEKSNDALANINNAEADYLRANNYFLLGQYRQALKELKKVPAEHTNYKEAVFLKAMCYKIIGNDNAVSDLLPQLSQEAKEKLGKL